MEKFEYYTQDVKDLFEDNVDKLNNPYNISLYSIVEVNTFKLVREYMDGKFDTTNDKERQIELLVTLFRKDEDVDVFKIGIHDIGYKLASMQNTLDEYLYTQLSNKYNTLKCEYLNYLSVKKVKDQAKKELETSKLSKELDEDLEESRRTYKLYKDLACDSKRRLDYYIIELQAALGLELTTSPSDKICKYCDAIIKDVNNNKYKRLSIESHFEENGYLRSYK